MDINQTVAKLEKEVTLLESMVKLLPVLVHLIPDSFIAAPCLLTNLTKLISLEVLLFRSFTVCLPQISSDSVNFFPSRETF